MPVNKRQKTLEAIKIAAYHDDMRTAIRIYTNHRLSRAAYEEAVQAGREAKKRGIPCGCPECNRPTK